MTLRDLYLVSNIDLQVAITTTNDVIFEGKMGCLRYSQMHHEIEEIKLLHSGALHIIVKEK